MTVNRLMLFIWLVGVLVSQNAMSLQTKAEVDSEARRFVEESSGPVNILRSGEGLRSKFPVLYQWMTLIEGNLLHMDPSATLLLPADPTKGALVITCSHCAYMPSKGPNFQIGFPSLPSNSPGAKSTPESETAEDMTVDQFMKAGDDIPGAEPPLLLAIGASTGNPYEVHRIYTPTATLKEESNIDRFFKYELLPVTKDVSIFYMEPTTVGRLLQNRITHKLPRPPVAKNTKCELKNGDWVMVLGFPSSCASQTGPHMTVGRVDELPLGSPEFRSQNKEFIDLGILDGAKYIRGATTCAGNSGGGVFNTDGEFCGVVVRANTFLPLSKIKSDLSKDVSQNLGPVFLKQNPLVNWFLN